jgi:hypothetical protein
MSTPKFPDPFSDCAVPGHLRLRPSTFWRENRQLAIAAYYNLVAAAIATLPAVVTGLLAWQWLYGGVNLRGSFRLHLVLGLASSGPHSNGY